MPAPANASVNGPVYVDSYLTNYSESYIQDNRTSIAQAASSKIPVDAQSGSYSKLDRGSFWRDDAAYRPLGGRPKQVGYEVDEGNYIAKEWALEHPIDDRTRTNAGVNNVNRQLALERNASRLLTNKMLIKQDRIWAEKFFQPGVWSIEIAGQAADPDLANEFLQFDNDDADPVSTIDAWKDRMAETTGYMPNVLVMGSKVRRSLRLNPSMVDRIKYTQTGVITDALLQSLFELDRVVTGREIYNAAEEGLDDDFTWMLEPTSMLLAYIAPDATTETPTAIGMFPWTGLLPGVTNALGGVVTRGRDSRAYSDWFHCRMAWDMKQMAPDLGIFFTEVVPASVATTP